MTCDTEVARTLSDFALTLLSRWATEHMSSPHTEQYELYCISPVLVSLASRAIESVSSTVYSHVILATVFLALQICGRTRNLTSSWSTIHLFVSSCRSNNPVDSAGVDYSKRRMHDFYEVLEVSRTSTDSEIKKAWVLAAVFCCISELPPPPGPYTKSISVIASLPFVFPFG